MARPHIFPVKISASERLYLKEIEYFLKYEKMIFSISVQGTFIMKFT